MCIRDSRDSAGSKVSFTLLPVSSPPVEEMCIRDKDTAVLEESAEFDWGVTYYPVNDDTKEAVSPCGDWAAAVSKDCENPEAAGKFLQWLMNTDNVASYAAAIAKPATRISAYDLSLIHI